MTRYKYCIVPMCTNTTTTTADKYFFDIPRDTVVRRKWCKMMKRNGSSLSSTTSRHVCQDHFDLENDTENYIQYRLVGGRLKLKKGIIPHHFECQKPKTSPSTRAERAAKKQRREIVSDLLESHKSTVNKPVANISPMKIDPDSQIWDSNKASNCEDAVQAGIEVAFCKNILEPRTEEFVRALTEFQPSSSSRNSNNSFSTPTNNMRIMKKSVESPEDEETYNLVKVASKHRSPAVFNNKEECTIFGEMVIAKIRKLNPRNQAIAQHRINNFLFTLEMQELDAADPSSSHNTTTTTTDSTVITDYLNFQ